MKSAKYGRHLPAFILLFLARDSTYGSALLRQMKDEMPYNFSDGPAVYRALNELEKNDAISAHWQQLRNDAAPVFLARQLLQVLAVPDSHAVVGAN